MVSGSTFLVREVIQWCLFYYKQLVVLGILMLLILMEYFNVVFLLLDYPLLFSGCRFRVPVDQRRAANGGFAAKVLLYWFVSVFQFCMLYSRLKKNDFSSVTIKMPLYGYVYVDYWLILNRAVFIYIFNLFQKLFLFNFF